MLTMRPGRTSAGASTYSLTNLHGDVFTTTDADGTVLGTYVTGPFGEKQTIQSPWNTLQSTTYSYVGSARKITEKEYTLSPVQMGVRVYIPSLGRFLSVDPIQGGTPNNYVYPPDAVNDRDLSGKWGEKFKRWLNAGVAYGKYLAGVKSKQRYNLKDFDWDKATIRKESKSVVGSLKYARCTEAVELTIKASPTNKAGKAILGTVTLNVGGDIVDGKFNGKVYDGYDKYNFDRSWGRCDPSKGECRSAVGEASTFIGWAGGAAVAAGSRGLIIPNGYDIDLEGSIDVSF